MSDRSLAIGVVALAASLDDVKVIGLVGHEGSVLMKEKGWEDELLGEPAPA
jgi:hypothetical protein